MAHEREPPTDAPLPPPVPVLATLDADALADMPEPIATTRRFCHTCGTRFDDAGVCAWCASGVVSTRTMRTTTEELSVLPALSLYFVLLGTFIFAAFSDNEASNTLTIAVIDAVIVLIWAVASGGPVLSLLRMPTGAGWLLGPIALGVATFGFASGIFWAIEAVFGIEAELYSPMFLEAGYGVGVILLVICLQPALIEELAFRGIIFGALRRVLSLREAMIVSSLMFAALHISPLAFPHTFVMGMIAAWMVLRTRSLWPGVILHFTHNFLCIAQELWWA